MADKKRSSKAKVNTEIPQFNIIPATPVQKSFAESEIESPQKAGPNDKRRSYVPQNYQKPSMPEESAIDFEESNHVRPIKVQWSPNLSLRSKQTNKPEERRKSRYIELISAMLTWYHLWINY